jgi:tRNA 2-thiocytidine biosynthesis protein TtcA
MKQLTEKTGQAIGNWQMISEGEKIAVGLSGGKDSNLLLHLLARFQRVAPINFHLFALHIDLGFPTDLTPLADFCRSLRIPLIVEKTKIGPIVFEQRQEKKPCSLCANMRRGALCTTARRLGIKKIALGHHLDDAIETLLMNMFYNGTIKSFLPVTYLDRTDITIIRPLVYLEEAAIGRAADRLNIPILSDGCPNAGRSKRQEIKDFIATAAEDNPRLRQNLLRSLHNPCLERLWFRPHHLPDKNRCPQ